MTEINQNTNAGIVTALQQITQRLSSVGVALTALATPLGVFQTGPWTPVLRFGGASTGITYSSQLGTFTTLGNVVIASFQLTLTSVGSATGTATIAGLPSTSLAGQVASMGLIGSYSGMSSVAAGIIMSVPAASTTISLLAPGSAATVVLTNANFGSSSSISGLLAYIN